MMTDDPIGVDLARRIYDYGLTADDLGPRLHGRAAGSKARGALDPEHPDRGHRLREGAADADDRLLRVRTSTNLLEREGRADRCGRRGPR